MSSKFDNKIIPVSCSVMINYPSRPRLANEDS